MRILFLPNWRVERGAKPTDGRSPNTYPGPRDYWFFKHWPGAEVDVIDAGPALLAGFEERLLRFYALQALRALPGLSNYDLIVSHGAQSAVLLAAIRAAAGISKPPHILIDVGCLAAGRSDWLELTPIRFALKSVSAIVYHAGVQRSFYDRYLPEIGSRAHFVPFGVDPDFFEPMELEEENCILSIGYRFRDWDTLVKAFRPLSHKTRLRIVGRRGALDCPNITFEPWVSINELKELMARSRVIALPLPEKKFSIGQTTLLGAMSMGKAVVTTTSSGIADYVEDGVNCLAAEVGDWKTFGRKMALLLEEPEFAAELGRKARESVVSRFSERRMAEEIFRLAKALTGREVGAEAPYPQETKHPKGFAGASRTGIADAGPSAVETSISSETKEKPAMGDRQR